MKVLIVLSVILAAALVDALVDMAIGIDFGDATLPQRATHNLTYMASGALIFFTATMD